MTDLQTALVVVEEAVQIALLPVAATLFLDHVTRHGPMGRRYTLTSAYVRVVGGAAILAVRGAGWVVVAGLRTVIAVLATVVQMVSGRRHRP